MEIKTPNGNLLIGENTTISLQLTNPMFNERGSCSMPFSVPWCEHNLSILGHPEQVSKATLHKKTVECTIKAAGLNEKGLLMIVGIEEGAAIELAFLTREALFYKWAKETMLPEISFPDGMFLDAYGNIGFSLVKNHANQPYPNSLFALFPVVVGDEGDYNYLGFQKPAAQYQQNYSKPSNGFKRFLNNWNYGFNHVDEGNFTMWERSRQGIRAHKDYAPFLYVNALLHFIFGSAGFRLSKNDMESIPELNRLCILNQATYAINDNKLNWDLLVPNITVMDFINSIIAKFNLVLTINPAERSAQLLFIDSILSSPPVSKVWGSVIVSQVEPRQVSISHKTISDDLVKESEKRLGEIAHLEMEAQTVNESFDFDFSPVAGYTNDENTPNRVEFYPASQYLFGVMVKQNTTDEPYDFELSRIKIGCLSHQREVKGENVLKYESEAAYPGIASATVPAYVWRQGGYPSSDYIRWNNGVLFAPRFMIESEGKEGFFKDFENIKRKDFPLVLCIYRGKLLGRFVDMSPPADYPLNSNARQPFGSAFPFDRDGVLLSNSDEPDVYPDTLSLQTEGENGLVERFFKHTIFFYEQSCLPVTVSHFEHHKFTSPRFTDKLLIDGVSLFLNSVDLEISLGGCRVVEVKGLTAKPLVN
ncbi:MAG: hypothetical protein RBT74_02155 [Tenuifilaceae bacterium]|jgi:hypothetical protein|nr:hypothetical protein [Tenuifilaceae bacterium]